MMCLHHDRLCLLFQPFKRCWQLYILLSIITISQEMCFAFNEGAGSKSTSPITVNQPLDISSIESDFATIRHLTERAINDRGKLQGLEALAFLGKMSGNRLSFDFGAHRNKDSNSFTQRLRRLLPLDVTKKSSDIVSNLQRKGLLSTNPDSVDGLPSCHLNIVSNGELITKKISESDEGLNDFHLCIKQLYEILEPYIYEELLPQVKLMTNFSCLEVSDVFIRKYGDGDSDEKSRNGLSAHYDIYAKVTSVIALDDSAAEGNSGLFTTVVTDAADNCGKTSNHVALRRFFPLNVGDAVIHTWDVLHGVDVVSGLDRTSLIVWFTEKKEKTNTENEIAPWLSNHLELSKNDVIQFVLATAIESLSNQNDEDNDNESSMNLIFDLYLCSASQGNAFALTRLGSLCSECNTMKLEATKRAEEVLKKLRHPSRLPEPLKSPNFPSGLPSLAARFWFEAAVRGNPTAQMMLADRIMGIAFNSDKSDFRVLAAVLFGLAAQQGQEDAIDQLSKVVQNEVTSSSIQNQNEFEMNPVVQTAQASLPPE